MAITATPTNPSTTHRDGIRAAGQVYSATLAVTGAAELGSLNVDGAAVIEGLLSPGASVSVTGSVTATTSFIIGSADLNETDLEQLDGLTAGTVTASKAVVVDANKDVGTFRFVRAAQLVRSQGAPTSLATAGAATYTIAQLLTGIIVRDCAGASRTDVLPTAELLVAGIAGCAVGDTIETLIINGSDPTTEILTIDAGAGGTWDANQTAVSRTCLGTSSKLLRIRVTNITPASEAYVAYF